MREMRYNLVQKKKKALEEKAVNDLRKAQMAATKNLIAAGQKQSLPASKPPVRIPYDCANSTCLKQSERGNDWHVNDGWRMCPNYPACSLQFCSSPPCCVTCLNKHIERCKHNTVP